MIKYETHEIFSHILTPEGAQIISEGSHEARVWAALPAKGVGSPLTPVQLKKQVGDETAKVGQGRAFKNGWIGKEGDGLVKLVRLRYLPARAYRIDRLTVYISRPQLFKMILKLTCKRLHRLGRLSLGRKC
jgi:hypothetical protein